MEAMIHLSKQVDGQNVIKDVTVAVVPSSSFWTPDEWHVEAVTFHGDFSQDAAKHLNDYINETSSPYQRRLMPNYITDIVRAWMKANGVTPEF